MFFTSWEEYRKQLKEADRIGSTIPIKPPKFSAAEIQALREQAIEQMRCLLWDAQHSQCGREAELIQQGLDQLKTMDDAAFLTWLRANGGG